MAKRLISWDDEADGLGLPTPVEAVFDATYKRLDLAEARILFDTDGVPYFE